MLRAAAVEALAERGAAQAAAAEQATPAAVRTFLRETAPPQQGEKLGAQTRYAVRDTATDLRTLTSSEGKGWVHRSYVKK
jgi:predicted transcriptional regulator